MIAEGGRQRDKEKDGNINIGIGVRNEVVHKWS
jgi:hypothetical protein